MSGAVGYRRVVGPTAKGPEVNSHRHTKFVVGHLCEAAPLVCRMGFHRCALEAFCWQRWIQLPTMNSGPYHPAKLDAAQPAVLVGRERGGIGACLHVQLKSTTTRGGHSGLVKRLSWPCGGRAHKKKLADCGRNAALGLLVFLESPTRIVSSATVGPYQSLGKVSHFLFSVLALLFCCTFSKLEEKRRDEKLFIKATASALQLQLRLHTTRTQAVFRLLIPSPPG